jgi:hypothetical protein
MRGEKMNSILALVLLCLVAPVSADLSISVTASPGVEIVISPYPVESVEVRSVDPGPIEFEDISYLMSYGTDDEFMNLSLNASGNGSFFSSNHGGVI